MMALTTSLSLLIEQKTQACQDTEEREDSSDDTNVPTPAPPTAIIDEVQASC
jgi:hypothetical protein